jgi:thymidylate synthase
MTNLRQKISELLQYINYFGTDRRINRLNVDTKETRNTMITFSSDSVDLKKLKLTDAEKELLKKEEGIVFPVIEQGLHNAVDLLKKDLTTRQAIIHNNPLTDDDSKFPCISLIHFLSDGKKLSATVFIRSSNVRDFLFVDMIFLNNILIDVAKQINQKPEDLILFISSAHVYQTNEK